MKSLRITLGVAAIALGTFTAFSFAPENTAKDDATGIFYVNADGQTMGDPVDPAHPCEGAGPLCSQEYNTDTELPTGNHKLNGTPRP